MVRQETSSEKWGLPIFSFCFQFNIPIRIIHRKRKEKEKHLRYRLRSLLSLTQPYLYSLRMMVPYAMANPRRRTHRRRMHRNTLGLKYRIITWSERQTHQHYGSCRGFCKNAKSSEYFWFSFKFWFRLGVTKLFHATPPPNSTGFCSGAPKASPQTMLQNP